MPAESGPERRRDRRITYSASAAAFVLGFVVLLVLMLPNPWALAAGGVVGGAAAAGTYGALAGRRLPSTTGSARITGGPARLSEKLAAVEAEVSQHHHQLPPGTPDQLRAVVGALGEIVARWHTLERLPDQQDALHGTITRHLPRTVQLFLELPDSAKPRYAEEFRDQVNLLQAAVDQARERVVNRDQRALEANRWLIEESLTDPDERLFKQYGID
ncbi:hypothetical protein [Nesterenkonia flava]|uniref:Uncharacterized protein n=1 Tax=Nesterenkonia flava TaxID=469799 RepID=A0ABU1FVB1_9MICC|nr:hypothetical protein [Nesterenkonia flava]MDR5712604.1 hypothetical protein [Nesterenkonia flava]